LEFLDYDEPVVVEAPPASEILDLAKADTGSG